MVSTFQYGFNVLFDEDCDPGFVSFQTEEVPLHPWGIEQPGIADTPSVGTSCNAEVDCIRLGQELSIAIGNADVRKFRIKPWTQEEASRAQERMPLIDAILQAGRQRRPADPFQPQIDAILERWIETVNSGELLDLIGLGSGSTPSGDDVLVGLLAGLTAFGEVSGEARANLASLRQALHKDKSQRTTQPSAQMIDAASAGFFPEPLCDLLSHLQLPSTDAPLRVAVENVLALGASSGLCMLHGLIVSRHKPEDIPGD